MKCSTGLTIFLAMCGQGRHLNVGITPLPLTDFPDKVCFLRSGWPKQTFECSSFSGIIVQLNTHIGNKHRKSGHLLICLVLAVRKSMDSVDIQLEKIADEWDPLFPKESHASKSCSSSECCNMKLQAVPSLMPAPHSQCKTNVKHILTLQNSVKKKLILAFEVYQDRERATALAGFMDENYKQLGMERQTVRLIEQKYASRLDETASDAFLEILAQNGITYGELLEYFAKYRAWTTVKKLLKIHQCEHCENFKEYLPPQLRCSTENRNRAK